MKSSAQTLLLDEEPLDLTGVPDPSPTLRGGCGYVYVVEMTNRMVKVGKSARPRRRLGQHRAEGQLHGYDLARVWISPPHKGIGATEAALVNFGRCNGGVAVGGRIEYFQRLEFDRVVAFADGLHFESLAPGDGDMQAVEIKARVDAAQADMAAYMVASGDRESIECAREFYIGMAFGRGFYNKYYLAADIEDETSVDALEAEAIAMVRIEAARLRTHLRSRTSERQAVERRRNMRAI